MRIQDLIHSGFPYQKEDFIFFLAAGPEEGCFCQWALSPFEIDGISYPTAEHWMMAEKARLFNDEESLTKIMETNSPAKAKGLGRRVKNWNQELWDENKYRIVLHGNLAKFLANKDMREYLLSTGDKIIVEAADYDPVWGIGLSVRDEGIEDPKRWQGENLLGFAIMETRDILRMGA